MRGNAKRRGICRIARFAFGNIVFRSIVKAVVNKAEPQVSAVVRYIGHIPEDFFQTLLNKPFVRILLNFNEIRHVNNFVDLREGHSVVIAQAYRFYH